MSFTRPLAALAASATVLLASACGATSVAAEPTAGATASATATAQATPAEFPRTVDVPGGRDIEATTVTVDTEPVRIAALSYEAAEVVAALGLADRLVTVPEAVTNPILTNHLDEMLAVEHTSATESTTDPEQILALQPDLVILSARHGLEEGAGEVLAEAGVPVLVYPNSWHTVDAMITDIELTGAVTGADAAAADLAATIEAGLVPVANAGAEDAPHVLILSNQAGIPFVTAGAAFPLELVALAGGDDVSDEAGAAFTGPVTAEQVVAAAPDAILLIDMNGSGEASFAPIMANEAVGTTAALQNGQVLMLNANQTQALGLAGTIDGLAQIAAWLGTDA